MLSTRSLDAASTSPDASSTEDADRIAFVIATAFVHSVAPTKVDAVENGLIGVTRAGKIAFVEDVGNGATGFLLDDTSLVGEAIAELANTWGFAPDKVIVAPSTHFLIPGFVDTHTHAPQYVFTGTGMDLTLLDWLQTYTFPFEAKFSDQDFARDVYEKVVETHISAGTTTASYFGTIHLESSKILADIIERKGQRAFVGKVNMDRNSPPILCETTASSISSTKDFIDYLCAPESVKRHNSLLTPILTPRFVPTCSPELMDVLGRLAREHDLPVQSHISENKDEIAWVQELHPSLDGYAATYDHFGLYTSRTIQAHAVHLTDTELALTRDRGVGISHCANSNFSLGSGMAPVRKMIKMGIKISLGTDVAGGYAPSMLDAIRQSITCSKVVSINSHKSHPVAPLSVPEAFYLATMGGAQVMGLEDTIGNLTVGKDFDAVLVNPTVKGPLRVFEHDHLAALFEKYLFLGDDRNTESVWVKGRKIV
ncbi:guanine deaminase [Gonapodya prolifera JEL478]|uniref:Guanine deaminase n=1 Tax=Gonapodya prolifera (strain JEL478) TaxID=1344416 RepID=A0A139A0Z4_GONPJ|nr:guanine deaminase [Gonapodya prolifera JEL478]|eukprot:KXS10431.1 guanine deaminase [Gonapodya prolifera JEL478]